MSYLHTAKEIAGLENIFKRFIRQAVKRKKRKSKKINRKITIEFSGDKLLRYSGITYIASCLLYYIVNTTNLSLPNINFIKLLLLLAIVISLLALTFALIFKELKTAFASKPEDKIINRSEARRNCVLIGKINSFSVKSINCFEERLKSKLEELNENVKDLDTYLPLFIIIMFIATRFILGVDVSTLENNINSFTGGLSFIASASIVIKILLIQSPKKKIRYYKSFLLVLKEAEIERNNM